MQQAIDAFGTPERPQQAFEGKIAYLRRQLGEQTPEIAVFEAATLQRRVQAAMKVLPRPRGTTDLDPAVSLADGLLREEPSTSCTSTPGRCQCTSTS